MDHVYIVPKINMAALLTRLEKLHAKSLKLGQPGFKVDYKALSGTHLEVRLQADQPKLNGWSFVAAITHTPEGNIIRTLPGMQLNSVYHEKTPPHCDHCDLIRNRNHTYIVMNVEGQMRQVGSSCLKDFTGHENPHDVAKHAELLTIADEACTAAVNHIGVGYVGNAIKTSLIDLQSYLARVALVVDQNGWVSKSEAYKNNALRPTAHVAWAQYIDPIGKYDKPNADHIEEAKRVVEWIEGYEPENDYQSAVKQLVGSGSGVFDIKHIGIVTSAVAGYRSYIDRLIQQELAEQAGSLSPHIAAVGKCVKDTFLVTNLKAFTTMYGDNGIVVTFQDAYGRVAKTFTSPTWVHKAQIKKGCKVCIEGTVKQHTDWKGLKETLLKNVYVITD